ncbi:DUF885 domain-containing protein [Tenacibaculum maritimum]|uniref:DUF885 domain-containing protein n=1 Tax=Tenacibaculum maritimum TaxID=107401 RepID=UPI003875B1B1
MNVIKLIIITVSLAFLSSCNKGFQQKEPSEKTKEVSKKLRAFLDQEFEAYLSRHPMDQTYLGIKTDAGKWNDISKEFEASELAHKKKALRWLKDSIAPLQLDKKAQLSYQLYKQQLENAIADYQYRLHNYPVNQMHGMHAEIPAFLINMHQVENVKDAENYIQRLRNLKLLFKQLVENLRAREKVGILPPKFVFAKVLEASRNIIKGSPFNVSGEASTLLADFTEKISKLSIPEGEKKNLIKIARKALVESVLPAYKNLIKVLEEQEKIATNDAGVWKMPKGSEFFNNALQRTTTTNLTAEEIHEIGLKEVARIHEEMRSIMKKVNFKGTLKEFFQFVKKDKQFYYPATSEGRIAYMKKATHIIDSMKTRLNELFITKPKAALQVKAVEAFREKSAGKAFYQQPAIDGSRPGTYYANMYDMESMPSYQMEALAYHEGIPGHHMQIAIAQELEDLPMFRKFGRYTAYIEGWGLYSEYIPKEMGFYANPYSDFGRLAMELWRACRLVVDTGIHAKKWTREEGIKYYIDNTPNVKADAVKMVERHIVMPSQATAYKIGMLKIIALRDKAKKLLGEKFDIREFHDVVLTNGPIPLNVLETLVEEYISSKS